MSDMGNLDIVFVVSVTNALLVWLIVDLWHVRSLLKKIANKKGEK